MQINGLKNKEIQDKINAKLKNVPYTLEKEKYVWASVSANFSNVLSVVFSSDKEENERKKLNFDLTTGEEITFEDLFVSSAPIKVMIASGMYEDFAWDKLWGEEGEYDGVYDMEDADTSEIEDQILLAVNKYDQIKDEIIFSFSPTYIYIYNPEFGTTIDMFKYANEIAIYKRYLTEESIYENDDLGTKGVIVFTEDTNSKLGDDWQQISYGKISDNIFIEEVLWIWEDSIQEQDKKTIINYINNLSTEKRKILKQETSSDKGVILQGQYSAYKDEKEGYYCININYSKAECTLEHFENEAFKDYIQMKSGERADVALNKFETYMQGEYPEMSISDEYKTYYLSLTGEFLGNTIEEVKSKIWE